MIAVKRLIDMAARGQATHDAQLVMESCAHLGGLSDDNDGCSLLCCEEYFDCMLPLLKSSIGGGSSIDTRDDLPRRRARTRDMNQSENNFYTQRTTTILLQLYFNIIQYYCNQRMSMNGTSGVKRVLYAESIDKCITTLSSYLLDQLSPRQPLCADSNKPDFSWTLRILSRTCELESVRSLWMKNDDDDDDKKTKEEIEEGQIISGMSGMDILCDMLESTTSLTLNNHTCAFRIVNLLTKWNEAAKEQATGCIEPTVDILEHYLNLEDSDSKVVLIEQCFGMLASMSYSCVDVMETMLDSNIGQWCVKAYAAVHSEHPKAVVQILGFLCSFLVKGGTLLSFFLLFSSCELSSIFPSLSLN